MESARPPAPSLRNPKTPKAMRLTDHEINPILSPCLAWFGGGGRKGPSKQEKQAAQQQQTDMRTQATRQAAAQKSLQEESAKQAEAQRVAQQQQMELLEKQRAEAAAAQQFQIEEMRRQGAMNSPAPAANIDAGDPAGDTAKEALRRKGMRKSILAGESSQAPMTTGYSTLG